MLTSIAAPEICVATGIYLDWTKIAEVRIPRIYLLLLRWHFTEKFLRDLAADLPHLFSGRRVPFTIKLSMLHQAVHEFGSLCWARDRTFDIRQLCHTNWQQAIGDQQLPIMIISQYQHGSDLPADLFDQMVARGDRAGTIFSSGGKQLFLGHVWDPRWDPDRRVSTKAGIHALRQLTFYATDVIQIDVPLDNGRPDFEKH